MNLVVEMICAAILVWMASEIYLIRKKSFELWNLVSSLKESISKETLLEQIESSLIRLSKETIVTPPNPEVKKEAKPKNVAQRKRPPRTEAQRLAASDRAKERWAREKARKALLPAPNVIAL